MPDSPDGRILTIDACKVVDRARELLTAPDFAAFCEGVVSVVAHEFAEHADPSRVLSEHEHDLVRFAAGIAIALDDEFEEQLTSEEGDGHVG